MMDWDIGGAAARNIRAAAQYLNIGHRPENMTDLLEEHEGA